MKNKETLGEITWFDLTVENAEEIRDFYSSVVGWKSDPVDMGGYNDFNMNKPGDNQTVTGICHAKGGNATLPAQWLIYITVSDVNESAENCTSLGGKIISEPKEMQGYGKYCVIQDPAGAVCALFEPK
jgi:predicted enzyme related to lactoylglutathione lyase